MASASFLADKDIYATDENKIVGPDHNARRRLIAKAGQTVPEAFVQELKLKPGQAYDDVPEIESPTVTAAPVVPAVSEEQIQARVDVAVDVVVSRVLAELKKTNQ